MFGSGNPEHVKHSVAVLIRRDGQLLILRRPDDDDELPGIWGLPAGSLRTGEKPADVVRRVGHHRLGVDLEAGQVLASGRQDRASYTLEMDLIEAQMTDTPTRGEWKWGEPDVLEPGRRSGSLCCGLALELFK